MIDLRSVQPLNRETVCEAAARSGRVIVVDEDYREFGLSGEVAATLLQSGISARFGRVTVEDTIPHDPRRERTALPSVDRAIAAAEHLGVG